ncbi:MAG: HEPN domain-containing protein [Methylomicrobium sp.]
MIENQDLINDYAQQSFRFTADEDYIAARMSYRAGLIEPFLWSSIHAIEKYLKALLLFNKQPAKKFGHNIVKLLNAVKEIEELDLRLPDKAESFIKYINEFGENRYFEGAAYLEEYALYSLDEVVWYIRRYCYDRSVYEGYNLRKIEPSDLEKNPKKYRLPGGLLEKIIKEKSIAYSYLVWDNFFYGDENIERDDIRKRQSKFSVINPPLAFFGKEAFDALKDFVDFSYDTKQYFKE